MRGGQAQERITVGFTGDDQPAAIAKRDGGLASRLCELRTQTQVATAARHERPRR